MCRGARLESVCQSGMAWYVGVGMEWHVGVGAAWYVGRGGTGLVWSVGGNGESRMVERGWQG